VQEIISLRESEKAKVLKALESMEKAQTTSPSEEARWKTEKCTVTLYRTGKLVVQGNNAEKVRGQIMEKLELGKELVLGIDETGRGEFSGPLVVSGVLGETNSLRGLRDSKKTKDISQKYGLATKNSLAQASISFNALFLDELRRTMTLDQIQAKAVDSFASLFKELGVKAPVRVDGSGLKTKEKGIEFIVKGDDLEPAISAASIVSKNLRNISGDKEQRKSWKKH